MENNDIDQYYRIDCPLCHYKTNTKVREDTILINFPLYCRKCKKLTLINVVHLKMVLADESAKTKEVNS